MGARRSADRGEGCDIHMYLAFVYPPNLVSAEWLYIIDNSPHECTLRHTSEAQ
jgi:hypothetical protein